MNKFEHTIEVERLKALTTKTHLRNALSKYFHKANGNALQHYTLDTIYLSETTPAVLEEKLQYLQLARVAQQRWVELGGNVQKLPQIYQSVPLSFHVNLRGPLEDILEIYTKGINNGNV